MSGEKIGRQGGRDAKSELKYFQMEYNYHKSYKSRGKWGFKERSENGECVPPYDKSYGETRGVSNYPE